MGTIEGAILPVGFGMKLNRTEQIADYRAARATPQIDWGLSLSYPFPGVAGAIPPAEVTDRRGTARADAPLVSAADGVAGTVS